MVNDITRGVAGAIDGDKAEVTIFADEGAQPNVQRVEASGFSSTPSDGGDAIILAINGDPSRRVIIALQNGQKIVADAGTTVFYSPDGAASKVVFAEGGVEFTTPELKWNGRRIAAEGDSTSDGAVIV